MTATQENSVGILIVDSDSGKVDFSQNCDQVFETSSVIKVALILLVFDSITEGHIKLDQNVDITQVDRHYGSGILFWTTIKTLPLHEHIRLVTTYSDCVSTNAIIRLLGGMTKINRSLAERGLNHTRLQTSLFNFDDDQSTDKIPKTGCTTPQEMVSIYKECLTYKQGLGDFFKSVSQEAQTWFHDATERTGSTTWDYYHKTGSMKNYGGHGESVYNAVGQTIHNTTSQKKLFALFSHSYLTEGRKHDSEIQREDKLVRMFWSHFKNKPMMIRKSNYTDIDTYHRFCCEVVKVAYFNNDIGLSVKQFDEAYFMSSEGRKYFASFMKNNNTRGSYLAYLDGKIIGGIAYHFDTPNTAQVYEFYVSPQHQGLGIGSQLWQKLENACHGRMIRLEVLVHSSSAVAFYFKHGLRFSKIDPVILFYPLWMPGYSLLQYRLEKQL